MPTLVRLVGVYDADHTLRGELSYWIGARLGRAHCALCDITHGLVRERDDWKRSRSSFAVPFDTFVWSGTIGTLILLVAYVLATVGCIKLLFVDRKLSVPMWEIVIPLAALAMLGYTIWRNVIPYPDANPARWFPVVAVGWVLLVALAMILSPALARRLSVSLERADGSA